jgi:hypothetical protein
MIGILLKRKINMGAEVHLGIVIGTLVTLLVVFLFQAIDWKKFKK